MEHRGCHAYQITIVTPLPDAAMPILHRFLMVDKIRIRIWLQPYRQRLNHDRLQPLGLRSSLWSDGKFGQLDFGKSGCESDFQLPTTKDSRSVVVEECQGTFCLSPNLPRFI